MEAGRKWHTHGIQQVLEFVSIILTGCVQRVGSEGSTLRLADTEIGLEN